MNQSELEHTTIIPGNAVIFTTTCACSCPDHVLTVIVSKETTEFDDGNRINEIDIEMFFKVSWNDNLYNSFFLKMWNRIKTAFIILVKGDLVQKDSFLFRSGEQAEAVYKAIGDAIESFRNGEKEIEELCNKYKNMTINN